MIAFLQENASTIIIGLIILLLVIHGIRRMVHTHKSGGCGCGCSGCGMENVCHCSSSPSEEEKKP
ncbi:MAG TPA: FeoB-associated Cys-rich membrane protein [Firmicutes bacterium]|nr:FeoB-associated Cys-rich membrane protein [Bacillota bacterium]